MPSLSLGTLTVPTLSLGRLEYLHVSQAYMSQEMSPYQNIGHMCRELNASTTPTQWQIQGYAQHAEDQDK